MTGAKKGVTATISGLNASGEKRNQGNSSNAPRIRIDKPIRPYGNEKCEGGSEEIVSRKSYLAIMKKDSEIIFLVEESAEGGYEARALGESIFTEAESMTQLKENIREAVLTHFD